MQHRPTGHKVVTGHALAPLTGRERMLLDGLADGSSLQALAARLWISEGAARSTYRRARNKLHAGDTASAVAAGYATAHLTPPELRDPADVFVLHEQRQLIPLIAQGMDAPHMAAELGRSVHSVRRDGRGLLKAFDARSRAHLIKQAWRYQALTPDQVLP